VQVRSGHQESVASGRWARRVIRGPRPDALP
jgi:hypothetical protein